MTVEPPTAQRYVELHVAKQFSASTSMRHYYVVLNDILTLHTHRRCCRYV